MEGKVVSYKLLGAKLIISVDPDKDGNPVIEIHVDAMEAFNEVASLLGKKSE